MTLTPKQLTLQAILDTLTGMYWLEQVHIRPAHKLTTISEAAWRVDGRAGDGTDWRILYVPHALGESVTCSDQVALALAPLKELKP